MKADQYLEETEFDFETVVQDNPTKSCDDAAKERGLNTSQIVKSLIIESEGEKFHVLIPGDRTLSESKFGAEYRMVPPKDAEEITGFEPGTVHPFSTELHHIADERIFENDRVSHTDGEKSRGLIINAQEFRKALEEASFEVEVRDIAVSTDEDYQEIEKQGLDEAESKFVVDNGHRKLFLSLSDEYSSEKVLNLLKAAEREGIYLKQKLAEKILQRAEDQTHLQRLVKQVSEKGELPSEKEFDLQNEVKTILKQNEEAIEDYREGQDSALNYLIGELMKKTNGKADAGKAREKFSEALE
jgi:prolyl-tRNA editing enzyme YbaK/EbsC (Cys-tRNA(Pro) deacylase)